MSQNILLQISTHRYASEGSPFLGSGTTAVAASLNGRKYLGIELKKEYFTEAKKNVNEVKKVVSDKLKKKI